MKQRAALMVGVLGIRGVLRGAVFVICAAGFATVAAAQRAPKGSFTPVKYVNNQAVTGYELSQRMAFLKLLGFNGDLRGEAMSGLIDDRLRNTAAKSLGLSLTPEALMAGMQEFAARGNLSAEDFVKAIQAEGIATETFRDFVAAGLIWRDVIQSRYSDRVVISEAAVDRALTNLAVPEAQTVRLAEIVLDASGGRQNQALALARDLQIDFIKGREFSAAARAVSISPTARSGGVLPARRLSELDETTAVLVRSLGNGQISKPFLKEGRIYLYQMLESGTQPVAQTGASVIDYAEISLPAGKSPASDMTSLRSNVDNCDDLYAYAAGTRGMAVARRKGGASGYAGVLQTLDAGEIAGPLAGPSGPVAVMLCARGLDPMQTASRDEVRLILKNQRLAALADVYLSELRADALIRDP